MKILDTLKEIWNRATNPHSPLNPVPEVRRELEAKGYKFELNSIIIPGMMHPGYASYRTVRTAEGRPIDVWECRDAASAQYFRDYTEAMARYQTAKKPAAPGPGPSL